jgi:short-subunit dehydrogenase
VRAAGYCATKVALGGLADALRVEVARAGVRVQMIYPGLTATEFSQNSILRDESRGGAAPAAGDPGATAKTSTTLTTLTMGAMPGIGRTGLLGPMPAEAVARRMLGAARSGRRDTILTVSGRALLLLDSFSPSLTDWLLGRVMTPRAAAR